MVVVADQMQGAGREGELGTVLMDNVHDFHKHVLLDLMVTHPLGGFGEGVDEELQV